MGFINSMPDKFVICADLDPPKGVDTAGFFKTAYTLKGRVDALIINDMPGAVMRMCALSACHLLKEKGFDAIYNLTCRDRNVLAIQSDILGAAALGIENIFITQGDVITSGDHPHAKPVNEVNQDELMILLASLKKGTDAGGNRLSSPPQLNIGAAVRSNLPENELEHEIEKMNEKINNGAAFFLTAPVFDLPAFEAFIKKAGNAVRVPVIAELIILKSVATARYINKHIEGINVPDKFIDRLYSAPDKQKESIAITAELIKGLKQLCNGVNIKAIGWEEKIPAYIDAVEG
jgi:methylenetetrahydrofolate reductase (NADPH)